MGRLQWFGQVRTGYLISGSQLLPLYQFDVRVTDITFVNAAVDCCLLTAVSRKVGAVKRHQSSHSCLLYFFSIYFFTLSFQDLGIT